MKYIEQLRNSAADLFGELHKGVATLNVVDFPDHTNIGDSAIYLGQARYWRSAGISVSAVYSGASLLWRRLLTGTDPIAIHGGGNLGGIYPRMEMRRLELASRVQPERVILQMPQSVVFQSPQSRAALREGFMLRPNTKVAARDRNSFQQLSELGGSVDLVPDGIHHLGLLDSEAPTEDVVILARTDPESAFSRGRLVGSVNTIDWPIGNKLARVVHRLKYSGELPQSARRMLQKAPEDWERLAESRMQLGVKILAPARTIVTDRLHGMLIGLQMGRRVIAVDNNNGKLSNYANTWLTSTDIPIDFAEDFTAAVRVAKSRAL